MAVRGSERQLQSPLGFRVLGATPLTLSELIGSQVSASVWSSRTQMVVPLLFLALSGMTPGGSAAPN